MPPYIIYMSAPRLNIYNACVWVFRIVATVGSEAGGGFFAGKYRKDFRGVKFTENESRFFYIGIETKMKFAQKKYDRQKNLRKKSISKSFFLKLSGGVNNCILRL